MTRTPRVYVDVVNYANMRFEAMAIQSYMDDRIEWWCPVCHEARIAWTDPMATVLDRDGRVQVEKEDDCPVCGCDVDVKIVP